VQQLISSTSLHELLCGSLAHGLQLLVAPSVELETQGHQCMLVLLELLGSISILGIYCNNIRDGGDRAIMRTLEQMQQNMVAYGECCLLFEVIQADLQGLAEDSKQQECSIHSKLQPGPSTLKLHYNGCTTDGCS
jgi:hypothetical protein